MIQTKKVTLNPGESQEVAFSYTPVEARTYYVTIDGLAGSFKAVAPAAELHFVGDPIVEYGRSDSYCWFRIYYDVRNDGGTEGKGIIYHHIWNSEGEFIMEKSITVSPGVTERIAVQSQFMCPCWEHLHVYGEGSWDERTGIVSWSW